MEVKCKFHSLKMILLYCWTHVKHYELEHQSLGRKKKKTKFCTTGRSQYEIGHIRVFQLTLKNVYVYLNWSFDGVDCVENF